MRGPAPASGSMAVEPYQIIEHPADVGFRAWGDSLPGLFASCALALMGIAADTSGVDGAQEHAVAVSGHEYESLLVNWLEEVLYLFDSAQFAAREFRIDEITPVSLHARLIGEPRDPVRHPWTVIVKAITYHGIEVVERNGRWEAQVFVDV